MAVREAAARKRTSGELDAARTLRRETECDPRRIRHAVKERERARPCVRRSGFARRRTSAADDLAVGSDVSSARAGAARTRAGGAARPLLCRKVVVIRHAAAEREREPQ